MEGVYLGEKISKEKTDKRNELPDGSKAWSNPLRERWQTRQTRLTLCLFTWILSSLQELLKFHRHGHTDLRGKATMSQKWDAESWMSKISICLSSYLQGRDSTLSCLLVHFPEVPNSQG